MSNLERRVARLEERRQPRRDRRYHMIWSEGPHDDGKTEIASRIAEGIASPDDHFVILSWLASGEDENWTEQRKAKNALERNRAANIGA
jgi:hypothetical protein